MSKSMGCLLLFFFLIVSTNISSSYGDHFEKDMDGKQLYIVYMGKVPSMGVSTANVHHTMLHSIFGDEITARKSLVHSYGKSFNGFAARLHPEHAEKIKGMEGVVSVFPNRIRKLLTTRSYDYLGLPLNVKRNLEMESDVVIGLLDTGISAKSPSFNDKGIGPPPAKWKGSCQKSGSFPGCNNKLIGASYFYLDKEKSELELSPEDFEGHGTHTSSTAAGAIVEGANLYGMAKGTARGAVPAARIAMYKVCWARGCSDIDILAAFDAAIADGVDVLSISVGGSVPDFFSDSIAIGAFHASQKGIFVSTAAGNSGPSAGSVENTAPWMLSVGASSTDRLIRTEVALGNGKTMQGMSLNTYSPHNRMYSLIAGADARNKSNPFKGFLHAENCDYGMLDSHMVKNKIVVCLSNGYYAEDWNVAAAGGYGVIVAIPKQGEVAFPFQIPAAYINNTQGETLFSYMNSTKHPKAEIYVSHTLLRNGPPTIASFSSRGPSTQTLRLLKPDLVAPGLNILAAFTPHATLTGIQNDDRHVAYTIMSGTSMACPHAAGIAAYVKSFHPDWSPAAIKSALITTAKNNLVQDELGAFSTGAGLIDPTKALSPGLVYEADNQEYIDFLCKEGYSGIRLMTLTGDANANCSNLGKLSTSVDGINYPSMQYKVENSERPIYAVFRRRVTNVGPSNTVYKAQAKAFGFNITVIPKTLKFTTHIKKRSFKVVVTGPPMGDDANIISGEIMWWDAAHTVRSPVVVYGNMGLIVGR